ncbi:MAG: hypothetical protein ACYTGL_08975 [Planctomycetota bacterium]
MDATQSSRLTSRWRGLNKESLAIVLCLVGHLGLCVFLSSSLSLGVDEAFTLQTTARGPAYAWQQAQQFELQPPIYFVLASLWRFGGDSIVVLRLFSTVCTFAAVALTPEIAHRYLPGVSRGWMTAVVAFCPLSIYAGTEARCYGFVLLLAAVLLLSFHRAWLSQCGRQRGSAFVHGVAGVVSLLTFYPLGFLLAAQGVTLVFLRRWRATLQYAAAMLLVGLCALPMLLSVPDQVSDHTAQTKSDPADMFAVLRLVSWIARDLVWPVQWSVADVVAPALWVVFAIATVCALFRRPLMFVADETLTVGTMTAVVFALMAMLAAMTGTDMFGQRYVVPLLLPLIMLCVRLSNMAFGRRGPAVLCCLALTFSGPALSIRYGGLAKSGDWRRAAEFVMQQEATGEPVVIFRPPTALGFRYYYQGTNPVVSLPCEERCERYDVSRYVLHDEDQVARCMSQIEITDHFWMINEHQPPRRRERFGSDNLEAWLATHCELTAEKQLHGSTVRRFRLRSPVGTDDQLKDAALVSNR